MGDAIPEGTVLFEVFALRESPDDFDEPWATEEKEEKIGEIISTSTFTTSLWGDDKLFFQHGDFRKDVRDKWREAARRLYIP